MIAELFAFGGHPGFGISTGESVLVRLGVVPQRLVPCISPERMTMASEEVSLKPVAINAAPTDAIAAVLERVRELGRSRSAGGCICISRVASMEVGVASVRAGWACGSVVALTPEGSSGAAWGGGCGGVLAGGGDGRTVASEAGGIPVVGARVCRKRRSLRAPGSSTRALMAPAKVQLRSGG